MREANDRFLDAFEEVIRTLRARSSGPSRESAKDAAFRAHRDGVIDGADARLLEDCCPLRHSLAHNRVQGRTMLIVSDDTLAAIEDLRRRLVGAIATVDRFRKKVVPIAPDATLAEASAAMKEHDYSALPVVSDDGVHGLLSGNDIVWWLGSRLDELFLLDEVAVTEVMHAHTTVDYRLVRRDMPCYDVPGLFADALDAGNVLGALLITATASAHEPLIGIVTPWDLSHIGRVRRPVAGRSVEPA